MASSTTSATSFELVEEQKLSAEDVEMANQEAQEMRTREATVAAGLVLQEPSTAPSATVANVVVDLSNALERLQVAFDSRRPGCPRRTR